MVGSGLNPLTPYQASVSSGIRLSDGGLLDNHGYIAVWNECESVLVSDGGVHGGTTWGVRTKTANYPGSFAGYSKDVVNDSISVFRTDLDSFSRPEAEMLINHGYLLAEAAIAGHAAALARTTTLSVLPYPNWPTTGADGRIRGHLAQSSERRLLRWIARAD